VGVLPNSLPDIAWVEIPGGDFIYQSGERYLSLPTFYMAQYPVTVAQFSAFMDDDGYQNPRYWTREGWAWHHGQQLLKPMLWESPKWHQANAPIVGMTWYEASAFAVWYALKLGYPADVIRLPSEEEWEKAARGLDGRFFPWGRDYISGAANINETYSYHYGGEYFLKRTTAVGAYRGDCSPYGVMDMSGNVREWTASDYHRIGHVVRGGGWFSHRLQAQTIARNWFYDRNGDHSIGFRLAALLNPSPTLTRFERY
jgi:formylglycine-generating enzyme required for sulfatase activity